MRLRCVPPAPALSAFMVVALALLAPDPTEGQGIRPPLPPTCTCPPPGRACTCPPPAEAPPTSRPRTKLAGHLDDLDESDEIAALSAIGRALSEVADGSSYVWHRNHGRLSGTVEPTASFKDAQGRLCRHVVVTLTSAVRTGRIESIACRMP